MEKRSVDVAIIGAGTAGLNARREAEKAGKSWVLIEAGPYGTTCARVGCMPSKLLIAASDAAHHVKKASMFGLHPGDLKIDGRAVMERVRSERDRFVGFVVRATEKIPEEKRLRGFARFSGPRALVVEQEEVEVEFNTVIIATGSSPFVPPLFRPMEAYLDHNDDVFEWEDLPASVAVVGAGVIGLELGQALSRLGVRVRIFDLRETIGPLSDPKVQQVAREVFAEELDIELGIEMDEVLEEDGKAVIRWRDGEGAQKEDRFERILMAAGRRPNLSGINLEALDVEFDEQGRVHSDPLTAQIGEGPYFLAGDVAGHRPLLHEASDEGRIAGYNAAHYPQVVASIRRAPLAVAFSNPQIAMVGERYADLEEGSFVVGEIDYADQGRARVMGVNKGLVRLYASRKCCTLIGAEMFGPQMEHMAHLLSWAVQQELNVFELLGMPFYHPCLEEGLRTALRDLAKQLRVVGRCNPEDFAYGPGS